MGFQLSKFWNSNGFIKCMSVLIRKDLQDMPVCRKGPGDTVRSHLVKIRARGSYVRRTLIRTNACPGTESLLESSRESAVFLCWRDLGHRQGWKGTSISLHNVTP